MTRLMEAMEETGVRVQLTRREEVSMKEVSFYYEGAVPSKSNYRKGRSPADKAAWDRIKVYQTSIGKLAMKVGAKRQRQDVPVEVSLIAYNQSADLDNLFKATIDGLKWVAFNDDEQVVRLAAEKKNSVDGPGLRVTIRWRDNDRA